MDTRLLLLPDGRRLAYDAYGDPGGRPAFLFHGMPGSRHLAGPEDHVARHAGLRLVACDRPGMGLSDYQPGRRILDWPGDVARLADDLPVGRFGILASSGGAPYALACALLMPNRVTRVVLVGGIAPLEHARGTYGYDAGRRLGWWLIGHVPGQASVVAGLQWWTLRRRPRTLAARIERAMAEPDRALLRDERARAAVTAHLVEAFRAGPRGVARDMWLLARPWGFSLESVLAPVDVWQGDRDRNVPPAMGEYLASTLPHATLHRLAGTGHLADAATLAAIFAALAEAT